jgi:hypothetical protein
LQARASLHVASTLAGMLRAVGATLDRRIASSMVARAQRRWPLLALLPASWIRPALIPTATVVRREFARTAVRGLVACALVAMLVVLGGP